MSEFKNILKSLRKNNNLTQTQLANAVGLTYSTISMYERGDREPDFKRLKMLANYFDVSTDYLLGKKTSIINSPPTVTAEFITFPVIGEIAAGYNSIALENWSGDTVDIPASFLKGHSSSEFFVLKVKGDSMYPMYQENDKVLILKQSALNHSGQVGAVLYDGELATLKKVEFVSGENWIKLIPINPLHPPKIIENTDLERCEIIGIPKLLIREISD